MLSFTICDPIYNEKSTIILVLVYLENAQIDSTTMYYPPKTQSFLDLTALDRDLKIIKKNFKEKYNYLK